MLNNVIHSSTQNKNNNRENSKCTYMVHLGLSSSPPKLVLHHGSEKVQIPLSHRYMLYLLCACSISTVSSLSLRPS